MIDNRIIDFINQHHVLSLATCNDNKPYSASCFYVYNNTENYFIFLTDLDTKHGSQMLTNNHVSANIVLETEQISKIQGLQITGIVEMLSGNILIKSKIKYLKRFPYAILKQTNLWILKPNYYKLTHNKLGFGKKIIWKKA